MGGWEVCVGEGDLYCGRAPNLTISKRKVEGRRGGARHTFQAQRH